MSKDKIPGGLADKTKGKFDPKQLAKGIKVEMEHTNDKSLAREIAKDHLVEDPKYYDHLLEMEKKVKKALHFASIFYKCAQEQIDPQVNSPNVLIEPYDSVVQDAVNKLMSTDANYFKGISKIEVKTLPVGVAGQVSSEDPTVVSIDAQDIKNIIQGSHGNPDDPDVVNQVAALITKEIANTIHHERAHVYTWHPEQGFVGGEAPAERAEQEIAPVLQGLFGFD